MSFEKINLIKPIKKALANEGYTTPTPIQEEAIPIVLKGSDLLGCAQTGTGKTAAFGLPILQLLYTSNNSKNGRRKIRSLILTPTRELASQIGESLTAYGKFTGLKNAVVFGGVPQKAQTNKLKTGIDILVATPGRLLDLMDQGYINLRDIELFVLDEADRMLDMGFIHDVKKLIAKLPRKRQSLFFSATMAPEIVKLSKNILNDPIKIEVTPESSTVEKIAQSIYYVGKPKKKDLLKFILKDSSIESALVFTRTKHGANKVAKVLNSSNIKADAIHGNKSQNARQNALKNFKAKKIRVLVATDIAARGIDIDELSHVINFELPNIPESYVHRIGRTGRAGLEGTAISFCDSEEKAYLKDIKKLIGIDISVIEDHPFMNSDLNIHKPKKEVKKPVTEKPKNKDMANRTKSRRRKNWSNKKKQVNKNK